MIIIKFLIINILLLINIIFSTTYSYHSNDVTTQLFEWTWKDIANECETFLSPKGYKAVQISPPNEHIIGSQWWTRYQPVSYEFISRSGNEEDFKDMLNRCNKVNVHIILDAVINHMAAGTGKSITGKTFTSRNFPGLYTPNDFHHNTNDISTNCQVNDYSNKYNVQYCDLSSLPDLNTSSTYVQQTLSSYLNKAFILGVHGIRIDAAKHQDATELNGVLKSLSNSMYIAQEVIGNNNEAVKPSMYFNLGQVTEFYYPDDIAYNIINNGKLKYLKDLGESWGLMPDQYAVVFIGKYYINLF